MTVKEQIIEQLEILPDSILIQIYELIQVFKRSTQLHRKEGVSHLSHKDSDPLIGLFDGPPDLAQSSEAILNDEINSRSGWSWKTNP